MKTLLRKKAKCPAAMTRPSLMALTFLEPMIPNYYCELRGFSLQLHSNQGGLKRQDISSFGTGHWNIWRDGPWGRASATALKNTFSGPDLVQQSSYWWLKWKPGHKSVQLFWACRSLFFHPSIRCLGHKLHLSFLHASLEKLMGATRCFLPFTVFLAEVGTGTLFIPTATRLANTWAFIAPGFLSMQCLCISPQDTVEALPWLFHRWPVSAVRSMTLITILCRSTWLAPPPKEDWSRMSLYCGHFSLTARAPPIKKPPSSLNH